MSTIGNFVYKIYHLPIGKIKKIHKQGGIINTLCINNGKREMIKASDKLFAPMAIDGDFTIHFLTGKKYWYQTSFCAYSLVKSLKKPLQFVFHDDGTFDTNLIKKAKKQFPGCIIHSISEINVKLKEHLPIDRYPFLNYKRNVYPHIRKLTDVHCGSKGWKLMLDSDMLFYKYPEQMINWLQNPINPFFILDTFNSYHYSFSLMEQLTGNQITEKLNVGVIGLRSESIDWDKLEYWAKTLEENEGSSYFLEQALSAMIVSGNKLEIGSIDEYVVLPTREEILNPTVTLHHYVAESKEWYLKEAWKKIL